MKNYIRPIICILLALLLMGVILSQVYETIDKQKAGVMSKTEDIRSEIETPAKKALNGYLGVFFRFKYLGNLNWLAIPLAFWFLWGTGRKKREKWQLALALVWVLTVVFISLKGYYNSRYQLTLVPFTMIMMLIILWELVKESKQYLKIITFTILLFIAGYNVFHYAGNYGFFWKLKVERSITHFPVQMVRLINSKKNMALGKSGVLVFNQPFFYYYTAKKGVDYMNPYYIHMYMKLNQKRKSRRELFNLIRIKYGIKYILIGWATEAQYQDRMLTEFLNCECQLLLDDNGYRLYEVRDTFLNGRVRKGDFKQIEMVTTIKPTIQGRRGQFEIIRDKQKQILTVRNIKADKDGNRLLQFGFGTGRNKPGLPVKGGQYLHVMIDAQIPKHLINRENYMFIQDLQGTWERQRLYFTARYNRSYLISRKIKPGSTKVALGIHFVPSSSKDKILIRSITAYVSNNPL